MLRNQLPVVVAEAASAGYDGIEIGAQHLNLDAPEQFRQLLDDHGLAAAGIHVGGELWIPGAVEAALANLERAIAFTAAVDAPCLAFSGAARENKSDEELAHVAKNLERIGQLCRAQGLTLAYHNHWWEIHDDYRELRFIVDHTDPGLVSLCLDVAWVQRGGGNPAACAAMVAPRVAYFHLKDTTETEWRELGRGEVDYEALLPVVQAQGLAWSVVEQDETAGPAVESARISRAFLAARGI
jgi:sugar phosphate isomerase/epimerase